jgi:hypothetical protein
MHSWRWYEQLELLSYNAGFDIRQKVGMAA